MGRGRRAPVVVVGSTAGLAAILACVASAQVTPAVTTGARKERPVDKAARLVGPAEGTTNKIVGGKRAPVGRFPFQVALIAAGTLPGKEYLGQFCGGALISDRWVVTAAHCVPDTTESEVDVYAGSVALPSGRPVPGTERGRRIHLSRIVSHQKYVASTKDNDIALLKLAEAAPAVLVPAIPATADLDLSLAANGKKVTAIGWGATRQGGAATPRLMQVEVTVQPRATCASNYQAVVPTATITDNMLCAGQPAGGRDSCQGDSGGFLGARSDKKYVQLGIVSWGIGCARKDLYGVYTRVANYRDWIETIQKTY
jgi:secreted trypsin-like serine protease